jgi:hypothetical protein
MGRTEALVLLAVATGISCPDTDFVSPVVPQGPPAFVGPPVAATNGRGAPLELEREAAPPPTTPSPLSFFKTQDSNAWVAKNFKVGARPSRVILVGPGSASRAKVRVRLLAFDVPSSTRREEELPVTLAVATLQEAAEKARGGDLIAVQPGRYEGFAIGDVESAADERFVHFEALGNPGEVVIDAPSRADPRWMVLLQGAHHVVLEGFTILGTNMPGAKDLHGPNAGILIDGDFVHTGRLAHHIAILGNTSRGHRVWGIHSVDSHTVLVQDNLFGQSGREHAAYFSDGSDDYVIRRNVFFGSNASGLQVNLDPVASLEKVIRNATVEHPAMQPSRQWAVGLLTKATERFGANAFPDGRGFNFIIEANVVNGNGRIGGAAINLAGVRESLIQNNLVYGNLSSGIAEWDNGNPFDAALVNPGPQSPSDVKGPDSLPVFGCFNNVVRDNTIVMSVRGRAALLVGNGSWGTRAYNNVLFNDELPSVELFNTSIWRFEAARNVLDRVSYEGPAAALKSLAVSLPDGPGSFAGVTRQAVAANFVRPSDEPWVTCDATSCALNPQRPDFHPRHGAPLLAGKADPRQQPSTDLDGRPRVSSDIGAYTAAPDTRASQSSPYQ